MPIGAVILFAGVRIPQGWIACDGSLYRRSQYPLLFEELEHKFGGQGQSFCVPDLRELLRSSGPTKRSRDKQVTYPLGYIIKAEE